MTITTMQQVIFTDYYEETYELALSTCRAFRAKFGGDLDEYISHTNEILMLCYINFDAGITPTDDLFLEVKRWVWFGLFDRIRKEQRWRTAKPVRTYATDPDVLQAVPDHRKEFDADAMRADLTPAATVALDLVLSGMVETAQGLRDALKVRGWGKAMVTSVFDEIKFLL